MMTVRFRHWRSDSDPEQLICIEDDKLDFVVRGQNILEYDIIEVTKDNQPIQFDPSLRQWKKRVRKIMNRIGVSPSELPDIPNIPDSYDGGMSPLQYCHDALSMADFPFPPQFDPDGDEDEQLLILATFKG
jgi:hypothetical protein